MSYTKLTDFAAKDALLSGNPSKLLRGTEIGAEFDAIESAMAAAEAVNITAPVIAASTSKTTPVDADVLPILDSAAANILKKVSWVNVKATLKTYFDTLYAAVGSFAASGANSDITSLTALTAGGLPNNSVLTADIADAQITPAKLSQPLTAGTAVATTSGTSHDFTSIPSWVSRMAVSGSGVSTNGTSPLQIQIGSGSVAVSGYTSQSWSASAAGGIVTSGFYFTGSAAAANAYTFVVTLVRLSGNQWIAFGIINIDNALNVGYQIIGKITLGGTLDRIRLTTINGTDTFDAGSVNILYE